MDNHTDQVDACLIMLNDGLSVVDKESLRQQLIVHINELLQHNFSRLIYILYRVDVSEKKLKRLLQDQPGVDAAALITDLLLDRQLEKIRSRQSYKPGKEESEEERW
jgi:hypothetical protein